VIGKAFEERKKKRRFLKDEECEGLEDAKQGDAESFVRGFFSAVASPGISGLCDGMDQEAQGVNRMEAFKGGMVANESRSEFLEGKRKMKGFVSEFKDGKLTVFYFRDIGQRKLLRETVFLLQPDTLDEALRKIKSRGRRGTKITAKALCQKSPTLFWNIAHHFGSFVDS